MEIEKENYLEELKGKERIGVLFVCLGNICRSPAAEGLMRALVSEKGLDDRYVIDSAGTGGWHVGDLPDRRMRTHARQRGIELTHRCRQVRESDFDEFDLIIGMDDNNVMNLKRLAPTIDAEKKVFRMADFFTGETARMDSVPDPYYEGSEGFELVLDLLAVSLENLIGRLG